MSKMMGGSPRNEKEGVKTRAKLVKQLEDGVKQWKQIIPGYRGLNLQFNMFVYWNIFKIFQ